MEIIQEDIIQIENDIDRINCKKILNHIYKFFKDIFIYIFLCLKNN